jgi:hypothetical protein
MNRATQITLEFFQHQLDGLSLNFDSNGDPRQDDWTIEHLQSYIEDMAEDYNESYDEDWYQIYYTDIKSPCIDWALISTNIQDERDNLYIDCLFDD